MLAVYQYHSTSPVQLEETNKSHWLNVTEFLASRGINA